MLGSMKEPAYTWPIRVAALTLSLALLNYSGVIGMGPAAVAAAAPRIAPAALRLSLPVGVGVWSSVAGQNAPHLPLDLALLGLVCVLTAAWGLRRLDGWR